MLTNFGFCPIVRRAVRFLKFIIKIHFKQKNSLAVGNLAVKGGEWELGRDVQQETKPFQIRKVYQVIYHPNGQNVVILELDTDFIFDWHLDATLIDDFSQIGSLTSTDYCFVTGWGKAVLQCKFVNKIVTSKIIVKKHFKRTLNCALRFADKMFFKDIMLK